MILVRYSNNCDKEACCCWDVHNDKIRKADVMRLPNLCDISDIMRNYIHRVWDSLRIHMIWWYSIEIMLICWDTFDVEILLICWDTVEILRYSKFGVIQKTIWFNDIISESHVMMRYKRERSKSSSSVVSLSYDVIWMQQPSRLSGGNPTPSLYPIPSLFPQPLPTYPFSIPRSIPPTNFHPHPSYPLTSSPHSQFFHLPLDMLCMININL